MIAETATLAMPRWVRMRYDPVRERHVLLAPERVLFPCPTSVDIIERLSDPVRDEPYSFGELVDELADAFAAPREVIARDVSVMLNDLSAQRFLDVGRA